MWRNYFILAYQQLLPRLNKSIIHYQPTLYDLRHFRCFNMGHYYKLITLFIYLNINYKKQKFVIFVVQNITLLKNHVADFRCRAVEGVGLKTFAWSVCGFENHRAQGCLSFLSVVCFQVGGLCPSLYAEPHEKKTACEMLSGVKSR
jgi:hypothetical protein